MLSCTTPTSPVEKEVHVIHFGYDFLASDSRFEKAVSFLVQNKMLFEIQAFKEHSDTLALKDIRFQLIRSLVDSLPKYRHLDEMENIGQVYSKNDETPWFVNIEYIDGSKLKIGSYNLPPEFKNYNQTVIQLLTILYN